MKFIDFVEQDPSELPYMENTQECTLLVFRCLVQLDYSNFIVLKFFLVFS